MPETYETEECRSCGAPVIWTRTVRNKDMPVDAEPVKGGNLVLARERSGVIRSTVVRPQYAFGRRDLYLSHFASCPQADKWRSRSQPARRRAGSLP